jgi:hypothetical protein
MRCENFPRVPSGSENQSLSCKQSNRRCSPLPDPRCLVSADVLSNWPCPSTDSTSIPKWSTELSLRAESNRISHSPVPASVVPLQTPFDKTRPMEWRLCKAVGGPPGYVGRLGPDFDVFRIVASYGGSTLRVLELIIGCIPGRSSTIL